VERKLKGGGKEKKKKGKKGRPLGSTAFVKIARPCRRNSIRRVSDGKKKKKKLLKVGQIRQGRKKKERRKKKSGVLAAHTVPFSSIYH